MLKFAVLGQNIGYSKSKDIFEAIFSLLNLKGQFEIIDCPKEEISEKLIWLKDNSFNGFSVTIPHKKEVMQYLDKIDISARQTGSVNSVHITNNQLIGHNTDCFGFSESLKRLAGNKNFNKAIILGIGGAAQAIIFALYNDFNVRKFIIAARDRLKTEAAIEILNKNFPEAAFSLTTNPILTNQAIEANTDIVVNCTPLGGFNYPDVFPVHDNLFENAELAYFDLNYNSDNKIVKLAKSAGNISINGKMMLVAQAVKSFNIWSGLDVDIDKLYTLVFPE